LERIIGQFSKPNDLIADFFCGSGTTLSVAEKLSHRWIGCDSSLAAIAVTRRRLSSNFITVDIH
jgi:adenine-specific DNA-methyltransferase